MDRRQALSADTEDDLLHQQQEFLNKNKAPAASVTRVTRVTRTGGATPSSTEAGGKAAPGHGTSQQPTVQGVVEMKVSDVLGEIQERPTPQVMTTHVMMQQQVGSRTETGQSLTAFPVAAHRKESKFALGRKAKAASAGAATGTSSNSNGSATPTTTSVQRDIVSPPITGPQASVMQSHQAVMPVGESQAIHRQNLDAMQHMSQSEVKEAVEEVVARLPASAVAFLKARGAKKAAAAGSGPNGTASASSQVHDSTPHPPINSTTTLNPYTPSTTQQGASSVPSPPTPSIRLTPTATSTLQPNSQSTGPLSKDSAGGVQGQGDEDKRLPADPRLFARLRWGLEAEVVGVQAREEVLTADQVLLRDPLRQDEGSAPEGHTITELLLLARSSHPPQRVMALQMLRAVLLASRPTAEDSGSLGCSPRPRAIPLPGDLPLDATDAATPPPQWLHLWLYLTAELGVASHLRLAMDDSQIPVVCAAVGTVSALLGCGVVEVVTWEVLDSCPRLGWPVPRRAMMKRVGAGTTWSVKEVVVAGVGKGSAGKGDDGEEVETPEDVAMLDPLAGLVQMQLLPRVCFLLTQTQPDASTVHMLLSILCVVATHSDDAAMQIVKCVGLLDHLKSRLLMHTQAQEQLNNTASSQQQQQQGHVEEDEETRLALQAHVLRVLRVLCSSSAVVAQLVRSSGVIPVVQGHLLVACASLTKTSAPAPDTTTTPQQQAASGSGIRVQQALIALEALRLWRVCAAYGISLMNFEGMYSSLCAAMTPPNLLVSNNSDTHHVNGRADSTGDTPADGADDDNKGKQNGLGGVDSGPAGVHSSGVGGGALDQLLVVLRWHVAREVHVLLDVVVSHALAIAAGDRTLGNPMIQPGTMAALASEAVTTWMSPHALRSMAIHMVTLSDMLPPCGGTPRQWSTWNANGMHPQLLIPMATAALSCWAAALHACATYWESIPANTQVWGSLTSHLTASGLITHPEALLTDQQSTPKNPGPAQTWQGCTQHLALALLQDKPGVGGASMQGLGAALITSCVKQLSLMVYGAGMTSSGVIGDVRDLPHANMVLPTHQVAVSEFLGAVMRLSRAVPSPSNTDNTHTLSPTHLAQHLLPHLSHTTVSAVACHHLGSTNSMQPWQTACIAAWQPKIRLLLHAVDLHSSSPMQPPPSPSTPPSPPALPSDQISSTVQISDALLSVLVASPPGAESQCLTALRLLTSSSQLTPLLSHAIHSTQHLHNTCPVLHLSTAGIPFHAMHTHLTLPLTTPAPPPAQPSSPDTPAPAPAGQLGTPQPARFALPYPPLDQVPDVTAVSKVLFEGWVAAWLSMVSMQHDETSSTNQQPQQPQQVVADADQPLNPQSSSNHHRPIPPPRLPIPYLDDVGGSRLPVPPTWHMAEALMVPDAAQQRGHQTRGHRAKSSGPRPAALHPTAAVLLHACGLEVCGSRYQDVCCKGPGPKLHATLNLAYLYNAMELVQQQNQHRTGGSRTQHVGGDGDHYNDDGAQTGQWMDPSVRWPLAVLTTRYISRPAGTATAGTTDAVSRPTEVTSSGLTTSWCGVQLAERLAQQFGASSFGDPLYSQHMALLLTPGCTSAAVQQAVWTCLAQDQALHLLPPLSLCVSPLEANLSTYSTRDSSLVGAYAHSLNSGELAKAQVAGSAAADLALATITAFVCDPHGEKRLGGTGEGKAKDGVAEDVRRKVELRAASIARGVVQASDVDGLRSVLDVASRFGWSVAEVGRALVQASRGDLELMTKLKSVLP